MIGEMMLPVLEPINTAANAPARSLGLAFSSPTSFATWMRTLIEVGSTFRKMILGSSMLILNAGKWAVSAGPSWRTKSNATAPSIPSLTRVWRCCQRVPSAVSGPLGCCTRRSLIRSSAPATTSSMAERGTHLAQGCNGSPHDGGRSSDAREASRGLPAKEHGQCHSGHVSARCRGPPGPSNVSITQLPSSGSPPPDASLGLANDSTSSRRSV